MFQQIAAVCLVIALAMLAATLSRKAKAGRLFGYRFAGSGPRRLGVVERIALTPQHSLCIARVDDREFLLGLHANGISVLESGGSANRSGKGAAE